MNNETPEIKSDVQANPYLKNNSEELSAQLTQIKEALATENGKDINAADLLGLELTPSKNEEAPKITIDADEVAKLQDVVKFASEKLSAAGISTDAPVVTKMSEVEQQLADKQEKMALAKFGEQCTELKTLDENLDVELIKSLNMATEDKILVASLIKTVATPYTSAISKLSGELESAQKQADVNAKFAAPAPEELDGAARVKEARANFGVKPTESKEKSE
jgi:hypothetical protein